MVTKNHVREASLSSPRQVNQNINKTIKAYRNGKGWGWGIGVGDKIRYPEHNYCTFKRFLVKRIVLLKGPYKSFIWTLK